MRNNPTSKSPKPLLSVEEAAILLGETRSTLYRAIKAGDLPSPHLQDRSEDPHPPQICRTPARRTSAHPARGRTA